MKHRFTLVTMIVLAAIIIAPLCHAETDYLASKWIDALKEGKVGKVFGKDGVIKNLRTSGIPYCSYGVGATETGVSAVEYGDGISHQTVLTVNSLALTIADGAFDDGEKIYTFPEGRILVEGVVVTMISSITTNFNASVADLFVMGMGTTTTSVNADGTITSTEVSLMPSTSNDTVAGTVTAFTNDVPLLVSAQFDGTTTATAAFINMGIPAANDSGANTNQLAGTQVILSWKFLGDYL